MPNYTLSRTSPPTHIYERKVNLGYGVKVDTSDAPTPQPNKGKEMNDYLKTLDVADKPATLADGTVLENGIKPGSSEEAEATKEAQDEGH